MRADGMRLRTYGLYCGVLGPIVWLALIAAAGALRPDFSHVTGYISELGERGSATELLIRYGAFGFTGFLYLCFAAALLATLRKSWLEMTAALLIALNGVGRIGAGVFPCEPGCLHLSPGPDLHRLFATIGFGSGVLAAILWGLLLRRRTRLRSLASFSVASGVVALGSLLIMSAAAVGAPHGLFEHLATVVLSVWLLVFAGCLVLTETAGARLAGTE